MELSNRIPIQNRARFYRWRNQNRQDCSSSSCVNCHTLRFKAAWENAQKSFHCAKIAFFHRDKT